MLQPSARSKVRLEQFSKEENPLAEELLLTLIVVSLLKFPNGEISLILFPDKSTTSKLLQPDKVLISESPDFVSVKFLMAKFFNGEKSVITVSLISKEDNALMPDKEDKEVKDVPSAEIFVRLIQEDNADKSVTGLFEIFSVVNEEMPARPSTEDKLALFDKSTSTKEDKAERIDTLVILFPDKFNDCSLLNEAIGVIFSI